jgi:hypothetical protein
MIPEKFGIWIVVATTMFIILIAFILARKPSEPNKIIFTVENHPSRFVTDSFSLSPSIPNKDSPDFLRLRLDPLGNYHTYRKDDR